ncbi:MAG: calcium-binding protein [Methylacidiphilales bacterium]|nr:calcium-binding protein [Candidatus Methylacidiphilales bacterium]
MALYNTTQDGFVAGLSSGSGAYSDEGARKIADYLAAKNVFTHDSGWHDPLGLTDPIAVETDNSSASVFPSPYAEAFVLDEPVSGSIFVNATGQNIQAVVVNSNEDVKLFVNANTDDHDLGVFTGDGDDIIVSMGSDAGYISAGGGDDLVSGGSGADTVLGGTGSDTISGGAGNDSLYGGAGSDTIYGGDGDDVIFGEAGNDTLYGSAGNDTLYGGDGDDYLSGGSGGDTFVVTKDLYPGGHDTIVGGDGNDTVNFSDRTLDDWGVAEKTYDENTETWTITFQDGQTVEVSGIENFQVHGSAV